MFFSERIRSIKPNDRVLEIGPGGEPHPRADVLLEKVFDDLKTAEGQRGYAPKLKTDKQVVYYNGGKFPFGDNEFDYVICSHVLEHIEGVDGFVAEINRIGRAGYLEYPLIYYDYIYNFPEHITFLKKQKDTVLWMLKEDTGLSRFKPVNKFFYESLKGGYITFIDDLKDYLFEGFEWFGSIKSRRTDNIEDLVLESVNFTVKRVEERNLFQHLRQRLGL